MRDTQHFIITRFNVAIEGRPVDREGKRVMTPEWMRYRLALFERYCLPSVRAQTNLEFTWLVRYDELTPAPILERLLGHERAVPNLVLVPSRRWLMMSIAKRLKRGRRWLLTTRLDSDDALHRHAVALIQASARTTPQPELLNLRYGYCYTHPDGPIARVEEPSNPFLSLVEPAGRALPHTASRVSHMRAHESAPIRQIGDEPMWLRVIHARNLSSRMYGAPCGEVDLEACFGLRPG